VTSGLRLRWNKTPQIGLRTSVNALNFRFDAFDHLEAYWAQCGAHFGSKFPDDQQFAGLRFCINFAAFTIGKSSEEGLEQEFNSIDAQRKSCEAYIQSQKHEGWRALGTQYDGGGYSGGSMGRPALQSPLDDIRQGKVNLVEAGS